MFKLFKTDEERAISVLRKHYKELLELTDEEQKLLLEHMRDSKVYESGFNFEIFGRKEGYGYERVVITRDRPYVNDLPRIDGVKNYQRKTQFVLVVYGFKCYDWMKIPFDTVEELHSWIFTKAKP